VKTDWILKIHYPELLEEAQHIELKKILIAAEREFIE
jgi:hypothetical protein